MTSTEMAAQANDNSQYPSVAPSAPYNNGPQYISQPGVQYVVAQPAPVMVQQAPAQPQVIYITVPPQQPMVAAANQRTVVVEEKPPTKKAFPLWIEAALFVCALLMMCGVGWYLNKFDDLYGKVLRFVQKVVKKDGTYWTVISMLVASIDPKTQKDISMTPAIGLMIPAMIISLIVGIVAVVSFRIRKNSKIIYFMTILIISFLHYILYVVGHQVTKPEKNKKTSQEDFKNKVNAVWVSYVIMMALAILMQTISFIKSDGFSKSAVSGRVGVWIVKGVGLITFYAYAVCIIGMVYGVDPKKGVNYVYAAVGLMAAFWAVYTALSFIRKTRTIKDDNDNNIQVVKVTPTDATHV